MPETSKQLSGLPLGIGVDLGGTKILAAVVRANGQVLGRAKKRTLAEEGPEIVVDRIVKCVKAACKEAGVPRRALTGVGVGAPGPANPETGVIAEPPNLPGWENLPLRALLRDRLKMRVHVDNDVNAGAWGEFQAGAGAGCRNMIAVFLGTGVGGGLILEGALHRGFNGTAGEIGHVPLDPEGPQCGCGRRGCLEAYAGKAGIVRRIRELAAAEGCDVALLRELEDGRPVRSSQLAEAWTADDPCVRRALEEAAARTGAVLGGATNLLGPERVILGGGTVEALGEAFVVRVERALRAHCMEAAGRNVQVLAAMLGDDAGAVGAALLALERFKRRRAKKA